MQLDEVVNPKANKKDQLTVGESLRISANASQRVEALLTRTLKESRAQTQRIVAAVDELPEGASKAEIRDMLNNLDATINLVVGDTPAAR